MCDLKRVVNVTSEEVREGHTDTNKAIYLERMRLTVIKFTLPPTALVLTDKKTNTALGVTNNTVYIMGTRDCDCGGGVASNSFRNQRLKRYTWKFSESENGNSYVLGQYRCSTSKRFICGQIQDKWSFIQIHKSGNCVFRTEEDSVEFKVPANGALSAKLISYTDEIDPGDPKGCVGESDKRQVDLEIYCEGSVCCTVSCFSKYLTSCPSFLDSIEYLLSAVIVREGDTETVFGSKGKDAQGDATS